MEGLSLLVGPLPLSSSLTKILERYRCHYEQESEASKDVNEALRSHTELLHIVQSQLEEPNVEQLSLMDLVNLEKQLDMALSETRARKTQLMMESIMTLQEKSAAMEKNEDEGNEVVIGFSNHQYLGNLRQQQTLSLLQ
ncbi:Transcription factor [Theobroma cacao]|nr:Transcription factor [Theobroma cacao]